MKNKRIILLLGFIFLFIVICFIKTSYNYKNEYSNTISEEKILKYLNSKYDGNFKNVKLLDSKVTKTIREGSSIDGSQFNTFYKNDFAYYYSVYSDKDDVEFVAVYEKQLPVISLFGNTLRFSSKKITDNYEITKKINGYVKNLSNSVSSSDVQFEHELHDANFGVSSKYKIIVNHNLTQQDYNYLCEFQKKLDNESGIKNNKSKNKIAYYYSFVIHFNNVELKSSSYDNRLFVSDNGIIYLNDEKFSKYILNY